MSLKVEVQDETCLGLNNGSVRITHASFDTIAVSLNQGPFIVGNEINNLTPGNYDIMVRLPNGCLISETFRVAEGRTTSYALEASDTIFFTGDPIVFSIIPDSNATITRTVWSEDFISNCDPCLLYTSPSPRD